MKKTVKLFGITLLLLALGGLFLAGCTSPPEPTPAPTPEATPEVEVPITLPAEVEPTEPSEVEIHVEPATEALLAQFGSYHAFIEPGEEGAPQILFTTNITVRDFRFVEIGVETDDDFNIDFYVAAVLYTVDELRADEAFVVTWQSRGEFPDRGISFIDDTGVTRFFTLSLGGDGSLWLTEML